jgi:HTH-type transcriptional regulator/antitoxin HigA
MIWSITVKIHTDEEHAAAMRRIDELWECHDGTEQEQEFEELVSAVCEYEEKRWPIAPPTKEMMEEFLLDQGVDPKDIPERTAHLLSEKELN